MKTYLSFHLLQHRLSSSDLLRFKLGDKKTNPILLIFKYYIYKAWENRKLSLQKRIACINKSEIIKIWLAQKNLFKEKRFQRNENRYQIKMKWFFQITEGLAGKGLCYCLQLFLLLSVCLWYYLYFCIYKKKKLKKC